MIQPVEPNGCNYFELLDVPMVFSLDVNKLESNYKDKQRRLHPDMYSTKSNEEKTASTTSSSTINQAYQILKNPVDRARYLLMLNRIDVMEEGITMQGSGLMQYVRCHPYANCWHNERQFTSSYSSTNTNTTNINNNNNNNNNNISDNSSNNTLTSAIPVPVPVASHSSSRSRASSPLINGNEQQSQQSSSSSSSSSPPTVPISTTTKHSSTFFMGLSFDASTRRCDLSAVTYEFERRVMSWPMLKTGMKIEIKLHTRSSLPGFVYSTECQPSSTTGCTPIKKTCASNGIASSGSGEVVVDEDSHSHNHNHIDHRISNDVDVDMEMVNELSEDLFADMFIGASSSSSSSAPLSSMSMHARRVNTSTSTNSSPVSGDLGLHSESCDHHDKQQQQQSQDQCGCEYSSTLLVPQRSNSPLLPPLTQTLTKREATTAGSNNTHHSNSRRTDNNNSPTSNDINTTSSHTTTNTTPTANINNYDNDDNNDNVTANSGHSDRFSSDLP
eukprot:gene8146-16742_t